MVLGGVPQSEDHLGMPHDSELGHEPVAGVGDLQGLGHRRRGDAACGGRKEQPGDTLTVHVYQGDTDSATTYYEDDGVGFDHEKGDFYKRALSYDAAKRRIVFGAAEGRRKSKFKKIEIVLHGFGRNPGAHVQLDGVPADVAAVRAWRPLPA